MPRRGHQVSKVLIAALALALTGGAPAAAQSAGWLADALAAHARADFAAEVRILRPRANAGDHDAQRMLGFLYMRGLGVPTDFAAALEWARRSADQQDRDAEFNVGLLYFAGPAGVDLNYDQAVAWFRKAADQGQLQAKYYLGLLYASGRGVPRDEAQAVQLWRSAAAASETDAEYRLGLAYYAGSGVAKDERLGRAWVIAAARSGQAEAAAWLLDASHGVTDPYKGGLGFTIQTCTAELAASLGDPSGTQGAVVTRLTPGDNAEKAGVAVGDTIVAIDGVPVTGSADAVGLILEAPFESTLRLDLLRDGKPLSASFVRRKPSQAMDLAEQEDVSRLGIAAQEAAVSARARALGLTLGALKATSATSPALGVIVVDVEPSSAAGRLGLRRGDVILQIAGRPLLQPSDAQKVVAESRTLGRAEVAILTRRGGEQAFVPLKLDGAVSP